MTAGDPDAYELDADPTGDVASDRRRDSDEGPDGRRDDDGEGGASAGERGGDPGEGIGLSVPEEHVGAFVAEAFEDPERSTTWEEVVGAVVADEARTAWEALSARERVVEMLGVADDYDRRALEHLERIPTDRGQPTERVDRLFEEATRLRNNADRIRDGIAAAFEAGVVDDADLVGAVEDHGFDTETIAAREDRLEAVTSVYDYDFRPYGGTLMDGDDADADGSHEVW